MNINCSVTYCISKKLEGSKYCRLHSVISPDKRTQDCLLSSCHSHITHDRNYCKTHYNILQELSRDTTADNAANLFFKFPQLYKITLENTLGKQNA